MRPERPGLRGLAGWLHGLALALAAHLPLHAATAVAPAAMVASAPAAGGVDAAVDAGSDPAGGTTLLLNKRPIATFRASLMGRTPAQRAALGLSALNAVLERNGPDRVSVWLDGQTAGLQVDGNIVFYLVPADIEGGTATSLPDAAQAVRERLQAAVLEVREMGDVRRIGTGLGLALLASALAWALLYAAFSTRRRVVALTRSKVAQWQATRPPQGLVNTYARHAGRVTHSVATGVCWSAVGVVGYVWATFVLGRFAYTRPWSEQASGWMLGVLRQFGSAMASAVPGLLTALLIFFLARLLTRAGGAFMRRVERGEMQLGWLDTDTAGPTRRISSFVVWLFALAIAYPFLPGANSDAFKGVSVLAGLMLSLGASGVVGQVVSGLSLMYSRSLRPGEYVKIGDTEGTVTVVGLFATKIHTGLGEEVSLPNAFVFSQPVRNFSRLVADGQFLLHTAVTIGYATPWRQVHAMLLEAARRAPGVAQEPPPYVVQTALSDFYVEYRLCAQSNRSAPRRRAEAMSQLHAAVQDVFNENGVQIMSPHYLADPPEPQVVPPAGWAPGLAPRAEGPPPAVPR